MTFCPYQSVEKIINYLNIEKKECKDKTGNGSMYYKYSCISILLNSFQNGN